MRNTVLISASGDPSVGEKFSDFIQSAVEEKVFLDELAQFIWSSYKQYGKGIFVRRFKSLPVDSYFDEVKRSGLLAGVYIESDLIPKQDVSFKTEIDKILGAYDPQQEFLIAGIARIDHKFYFSSVALAYPDSLLLKWTSSKTKLSRVQIKKRLCRLIQAGQRLLVLDAEEPFVKDNLELWIEEANKLPITIVISSNTAEPVSQLPPTF